MMLVIVNATKLFNMNDPLRCLVVHFSGNNRVLNTTDVRVTFGVKGTITTCYNNLVLRTKFSFHCPTLMNVPFTILNSVLLFVLRGGCRQWAGVCRRTVLAFRRDTGWLVEGPVEFLAPCLYVAGWVRVRWSKGSGEDNGGGCS